LKQKASQDTKLKSSPTDLPPSPVPYPQSFSRKVKEVEEEVESPLKAEFGAHTILTQKGDSTVTLTQLAESMTFEELPENTSNFDVPTTPVNKFAPAPSVRLLADTSVSS
jgi:hypothetical protein